jgi:hypothetical protein
MLATRSMGKKSRRDLMRCVCSLTEKKERERKNRNMGFEIGPPPPSSMATSPFSRHPSSSLSLFLPFPNQNDPHSCSTGRLCAPGDVARRPGAEGATGGGRSEADWPLRDGIIIVCVVAAFVDVVDLDLFVVVDLFLGALRFGSCSC